MPNWKPEVRVAGEGDKWLRNGLVFATKAEAEASAKELMGRWILVTDCQAGESDDPVNYRWDFEAHKMFMVPRA